MNTRLSASFTDWVAGQSPTAEQLLALYESDFVMAFAVDNMDDDAFTNWLKDFEEPNPEFPIAPTMKQAAKWADLFGDSVCVFYDKANEEGEIKNFDMLAKKFSGIAAGVDAFHPIANDDGYEDPSPADLDDLGIPKYYWVHVRGLLDPDGKSKRIKVDASRVVRFIGLKTRHSYRGLYIGMRSLDDLINYRRWRAAYGIRAGDVAVPAFHLNKESGEWTDAEKTSIENAFGEDKTARTIGKVTMNPISQPLSVGELDSTALGLLNAIANDLGVMVNDIFQNQGNAEKVAPDSNQTSYIQAIKGRQDKHTDSMRKVLKGFGMEFNGWNTPWEEPFAQQLTNISTLANIMNTSMDPETRAIAKALLVTTYGEKIDYAEYLDEQRTNVEHEQQQLDAFTRAGGDGAASSSRGGDKPGKAKPKATKGKE